MKQAINTFASNNSLDRSERGRVIAGICAGLGERFGIDPWILRAGLILSTFFGGLAIFVYLLAWIALPVGSAGQPEEAEVVGVQSAQGRMPGQAPVPDEGAGRAVLARPAVDAQPRRGAEQYNSPGRRRLRDS